MSEVKEKTPKYLLNRGQLATKRYNEFAIFRQNILMLRASKNVTQHQLSEILNIRPKRIEDYEIGRCHPSFDEIRTISKYFEVTLDQLLYKKATVTFEP